MQGLPSCLDVREGMWKTLYRPKSEPRGKLFFSCFKDNLITCSKLIIIVLKIKAGVSSIFDFKRGDPDMATTTPPKPTPPKATTKQGSSNSAKHTNVFTDDLYYKLKYEQRQLAFAEIQEEYTKEEQKNLKRELLRAQEEVKRIQSVPLVIGQFLEMVDSSHGIVGSTTGSNYYVRILSTINRELLKPASSVALHRHSNALVDVLPPEADSSISLLTDSEKPDVTYNV